jgi:hypothetical protein
LLESQAHRSKVLWLKGMVLEHSIDRHRRPHRRSSQKPILADGPDSGQSRLSHEFVATGGI